MKSLTPIILIILAVGLFFWQIKPTYSRVKELRAEQAQYDEALRVAAELEETRAALAKTLNDFSKTDLDKLATFLPDHFDSIRIILDINSIAATHGIVPKDIKTSEEVLPAKGAPAKSYKTATISFSFATSYPKAVAFLRDLEASLRLLDVSAIEIKPDGKTGGFNFGMTINTYWISRK